MQAQLLRARPEESAKLRSESAVQKRYSMELLTIDPLKWLFQVVDSALAESEGKEGGVCLVAEYTEDIHSLGQYVQDAAKVLFETFLHLENCDVDLLVEPDRLKDGFDYLNGKSFGEINRVAYESTLAAHSQRLPCLVLPLPRLDAENLGKLFYFFLFACYLSSKILGVNPFNQPGVEEYNQDVWRWEKRRFEEGSMNAIETIQPPSEIAGSPIATGTR